jgi:hypothetical protein
VNISTMPPKASFEQRKEHALRLASTFCYYCERPFDDDRTLLNHQRQKHFLCDDCGKRLNTIGGLKTHVENVHKGTISTVANAIEGRQDIRVEIYAMEGVPPEMIATKRAHVLAHFDKEQADHFARTGNPLPGTPEALAIASKKRKADVIEETSEERIARSAARVAEMRARKAARLAAGNNASAGPASNNISVGPASNNASAGSASNNASVGSASNNTSAGPASNGGDAMVCCSFFLSMLDLANNLLRRVCAVSHQSLTQRLR